MGSSTGSAAVSDSLDLTFAALADPTRRAMLARLASGEATVNELAEPFALSQPAISKHLKVLERAGLISRSRAAQTRPCRLEAARLHDVAQWVASYRSLWEASFDRLDALLQATATRTSTPTPSPKGKRHVRKP
ncbi:metalloregulator ArsR/SmtB family transcription factor [Rhizobacter sp. SG703]|uniref:ArsR/SmtB family transcription factor n=1 Tax=Rhizobacter sp. SG703 TaxID=2587140 RepID=UPI0014470CCF|nr:metalloregulator ArsR/SmtB family transcription factor [Rhizobacter sp. SG703]NKI95972.1 DNA-binding transcriptional ArsR family regulator [Rhizobacter sp. SG703]